MFDRLRSRSAEGAFSSFAAPGYATLWWAGLFSFMSVQMQFLLRGVLAWDLTLREGALGLTYLCFGVSMLISTPLGGVATDRFPKRLVLIASQAVIVAAATGMGLVVVTGVVEFWMLLLAAVAQGTAFGFFGPARVAIASDIVGREHLGNAITLSLLSMSGTRVFAPALAGVLAGVAFIGIGGAYLISALCSLISFVYLLRLPKPSRSSSDRSGDDTMNLNGTKKKSANPLAEIKAGVGYVFDRPPLRRLVISSFFVIMFGFNYVAFYPALVKGQFGLGDAWVGYISSASAFGAVAVSLPLAARADSARAKTAMVMAGICFGLGVMAFGAAGSFWVAFAIICFIGAATTIFQSLSNTLALGLTDDNHQGRVQSLMQLSFAGFGMAALPLGLLAELIGLRPTIMIMGAIATSAIVAYLVLEGGWKALKPPVDDAGISGQEAVAASVDSDVDLARSPTAGS